MTNKILQAPADEQRVCVTCGFCCDATMFLHAHLKHGEREKIPEKMAVEIYVENGEEYFLQPCFYFSGKCTIYGQMRAEVCGTYRCQLLRDFAAGRLGLPEALNIVASVREMRSAIIDEFKRLTGREDAMPFRHILRELGRLRKENEAGVKEDVEMEQFVARCNIFEALLIKNFRSSEEFDKMIMK